MLNLNSLIKNSSLFFAFGAVGFFSSQTRAETRADEKTEQSEVLTLVIDQGADLEHQSISSLRHQNEEEFHGQTRSDDDGDGFSDNVSGWNHLSQDPQYMPEYLLAFFKGNPEQTRKDLGIYSRIEKGDEKAIQEYSSDLKLQNRIGLLLDSAHGTHVAGIVALQGGPKVRIHNLNIFSPSSLNQTGNPDFRIFSAREQIRELNLKALALKPDVGSIFDSKETVNELVQERASDTRESLEKMTKYISAVQPRVVNLSLGTSLALIYTLYQSYWRMELMGRKLDPNTAMTEIQKKNFSIAVAGTFAAHKQEWARMFSTLPKIMFVVAAGNDGSPYDSTYGNLDVMDAVPASLAEYFPNVVTVVATDSKGALTDFSNFSAKRSTLGAFGKAVASAAPDNNYVQMSGTSMAAPFVAGVVAQMISENPKLKVTELRKLLEKSVTPHLTLKGKTASGGNLNKEMAIAAARKSKSSLFGDLLEEIGNWNNSPENILLKPILNRSLGLNEFFDAPDTESETAEKTHEIVRKRMSSWAALF